MEDLVHVGLAQGTAEGGEEQAGHQEGAAQGGREVVALQLRHAAQPRPGLSPGQTRAQNPARKDRGGRASDGRAGTRGMPGERWPEAQGGHRFRSEALTQRRGGRPVTHSVQSSLSGQSPR